MPFGADDVSRKLSNLTRDIHGFAAQKRCTPKIHIISPLNGSSYGQALPTHKCVEVLP